MIPAISSHVKDLIKPAALPLWLKLQESAVWHKAVSSFTEDRPERPFQAFGIGLPKTGTVSLANLLKKSYHATHEPETWILTHILQRTSLGEQNRLGDAEAINILKTRDRLIYSSFESNFVLGMLIDVAYEAFPSAKYILTIRDCYSWVNSEINQQHLIGNTQPWGLLADYRYGKRLYYPGAELALKRHGLYPLSSYFTYWAEHIQSVLDTIPTNKLLVIRTRDLNRRTQEIADFLEVPHDTLDTKRVHSHRRKRKPLDIRELVDSSHLREQALIHCGDIMDQFYAEDKVADEFK